MKNRRLAIIIGLGVVELWIVGLMLRSVHGNSRDSSYSAREMSSFGSAAQAAAGGRAPRTVETGAAPHVTIDDGGATLSVSVRAGTTVTVSEERRPDGWVRGGDHPVSVERTSDGVRIAQSDSGFRLTFGSVERRLDVVVPPGADLEVVDAGSTTVSGLRGDATLHSDDGSVFVNDVHGTVNVKTDNGRIELHDVQAPSVDIGSDNGRIVFDRVHADEVAIATDNGRIEITRSLLRSGKIQTDSGRIRLGLDPSSDVTVTAHAGSGKVIAQAPLTAKRSGDDDDAPSTIRIGTGAGRLEVGSDDGSITVLTGGA